MSQEPAIKSTPDELAHRWVQMLPNSEYRVHEAFARWLRSSPCHIAAYLRQKMLDIEIHGLDPARQIDVTRYVIRAKSRKRTHGMVIRSPLWDSPNQPTRIVNRNRHGTRGHSVAGIALFTVAFVLCLARPQSLSHHSISRTLYATGLGEQHRVSLPDGSTLTLGAQSKVEVTYTASHREVRLINGQALFDIQHDSTRPFYVRVGHTLIEDVGTTFDVLATDTGTTVVVVQGRVRVSNISGFVPNRLSSGKEDSGAHIPVELTRGDETFIPPGGRSHRPMPTALSTTQLAARTSWTTGRLVLDQMSLENAVEEINRYNRVKIVIADGSLRSWMLGGTVRLRAPQDFADALRTLGCRVEIRASVITVSRPPESTTCDSSSAGRSGT